MRTFVLGVALVAILAIAALTVNAVIQGGFDVLTLLSLLVIALFGFGIVGALLHPPEDP